MPKIGVGTIFLLRKEKLGAGAEIEEFELNLDPVCVQIITPR
jgi:hypothetical protein